MISTGVPNPLEHMNGAFQYISLLDAMQSQLNWHGPYEQLICSQTKLKDCNKNTAHTEVIGFKFRIMGILTFETERSRQP